MTDRPMDKCGVFGIYGRDLDVARTTFFGLYALQHRGQESAGIATSDGDRIAVHARMGLVAQVFDEDDLAELKGHIAIGHTRYSTTGSSNACNAQPLLVDGPAGQIALAHNGNLVNAQQLRDELVRDGFQLETTTDSEVIGAMIVSAPGETWADRIAAVMPRLIGAYSLSIMTRDELIAVRDPLAVRPLCIGRKDGAWCVSSESCALDTVGAQFIREIEPGEIVTFGANGVSSKKGPRGPRRASCLFEYFYVARPDSVIDTKLVYEARFAMGRELARLHPVEADLVIGVPTTALPAAHGYADEADLPYRDGLVSNRYIHRTFIQPDQSMRRQSAQLKYNALPEVVRGQRLVVVDDSIVRGTSQEAVVTLLRRAGAREVHLRVCAPPLRHPCFLGVDMPTYNELIAHRLQSVEAIRDAVGADSLGYLSLDASYRAVGLAPEHFCTACFSGDYPVSVQLELDKLALER
jgi:amidophosphoribosyltransferase